MRNAECWILPAYEMRNSDAESYYAFYTLVEFRIPQDYTYWILRVSIVDLSQTGDKKETMD